MYLPEYDLVFKAVNLEYFIAIQNEWARNGSCTLYTKEYFNQFKTDYQKSLEKKLNKANAEKVKSTTGIKSKPLKQKTDKSYLKNSAGSKSAIDQDNFKVKSSRKLQCKDDKFLKYSKSKGVLLKDTESCKKEVCNEHKNSDMSHQAKHHEKSVSIAKKLHNVKHSTVPSTDIHSEALKHTKIKESSKKHINHTNRKGEVTRCESEVNFSAAKGSSDSRSVIVKKLHNSINTEKVNSDKHSNANYVSSKSSHTERNKNCEKFTASKSLELNLNSKRSNDKTIFKCLNNGEADSKKLSSKSSGENLRNNSYCKSDSVNVKCSTKKNDVMVERSNKKEKTGHEKKLDRKVHFENTNCMNRKSHDLKHLHSQKESYFVDGSHSNCHRHATSKKIDHVVHKKLKTSHNKQNFEQSQFIKESAGFSSQELQPRKSKEVSLKNKDAAMQDEHIPFQLKENWTNYKRKAQADESCNHLVQDKSVQKSNEPTYMEKKRPKYSMCATADFQNCVHSSVSGKLCSTCDNTANYQCSNCKKKFCSGFLCQHQHHCLSQGSAFFELL